MTEPSKLMFFDKKLNALVIVGSCPKCKQKVEFNLCEHCVEKIMKAKI